MYQSPNIVAKKKKLKGEELFIVIARRAARDAAERSSAGWRITSGCLRVCLFFCVFFLSASLPPCQTELRLFVNLHRLVQRPSVEHFKESIRAKWYLKTTRTKKKNNSKIHKCVVHWRRTCCKPRRCICWGFSYFTPPTSQLLGERSSGTLKTSSFGCNMLPEIWHTGPFTYCLFGSFESVVMLVV